MRNMRAGAGGAMSLPITAVWPGTPYPRGATWDGEGVNFALFSEHAERVELCLFDASGRRELQRIALPRAHRPRLARLPARGAARACSTATASMAPTTRSAATASIRTSC